MIYFAPDERSRLTLPSFGIPGRIQNIPVTGQTLDYSDASSKGLPARLQVQQLVPCRRKPARQSLSNRHQTALLISVVAPFPPQLHAARVTRFAAWYRRTAMSTVNTASVMQYFEGRTDDIAGRSLFSQIGWKRADIETATEGGACVQKFRQ
jgi:hypothetical protein